MKDYTNYTICLLDDCCLDVLGRSIKSSESPAVPLRNTEYHVLMLLVENEGAVVKRSKIIDTIWETDLDIWSDQCLTNVISQLRKRFPVLRKLITTYRGVGYLFNRGSVYQAHAS